MATRLYFNGDAMADPGSKQPAFDAAWDVTSSAVRRRVELSTAHGGGSDSLSATKTVAGPVNVLIAQYVFPGLAAATISGYVKGHMIASETSTSADASFQCVIRVWDPIGETFRGTLLAATAHSNSATPGAAGYELSTVTTNRKLPTGWSGSGAALSSVDAEDGDWLVVEVGVRSHEAGTTTRTFTVRSTQLAANADLPEDETTTTTTLNPWIEFSQTLDSLAFATPAMGQGPGHIGTKFRPVSSYAGGGGAVVPTVGQIWPRGNRGT